LFSRAGVVAIFEARGGSLEQTEGTISSSDSWTDEQIVARILAGETELFELIVRRHSRKLYRVAIAVLRHDSDAEDIVQDTFCSAFQHLGQFAQRASFSTWLTRIALYRALGDLRSKRREVPMEDEEGRPLSAFVHRGPNPEQMFYAQEKAMVLNSAIEALPANYRRVLLMRDIAEVDTATTARNLRLTQTNVKVRLHRARTMLRRESAQSLGCLQRSFLAPRKGSQESLRGARANGAQPGARESH
jgi:RNA polymerase sigma-70 factor, ECF subfamily